MKTIHQLLKSKKFIAALAGVLAGVGARYGLQLETETIAVLISPIVAYIVAQGQADKGKEAAKVEINLGEESK